jgi:serine/threonine protein kinase/predicted  nucleic acid-binding Zn-ribbon protein
MKLSCQHCGKETSSDDLSTKDARTCPNCGGRLAAPDSSNATVADVADATVDSREEATALVEDPDRTIADDSSAADTTVDGATEITRGPADDRVETGVDVSASLSPGNDARYTRGLTIARGGMGEILDAKDVNIRRNVAMKVMIEADDASRQQIVRFIEEAQITGQLEHPSIVPVYELGKDSNGEIFYTMKYVKGITLKAIVREIRAGNREIIAGYPLAHLLTIFQKLCDGIAFAHSKGVIHRDLKPENIMAGNYGEVYVMDWGLAKALDAVEDKEGAGIDSVRKDQGAVEMTRYGDIMGTPGFMSPEQAVGRAGSLDERTDIYALGAILYNILTLVAPVTGADLHTILEKTCGGEIVRPTEYNPTVGLTRFGRASEQPKNLPEWAPEPAVAGLAHCPRGMIPASLSAVAMKALALDPTNRYQTVKALQADIEAYQNGFATEAEEASLWQLIKLFVKRHKAATGAAAILLVVIAVSAAVNLAEQEKRRRVRRNAAPDKVKTAMALADADEIGPAFEMIEVAVDYDRRLPEARFVYAVLLFHQTNYVQAIEEGERFEQLASGTDKADAKRLLEIFRVTQEEGRDAIPAGRLNEIVSNHGMPTLGAGFIQEIRNRLPAYREKINAAWPGLGDRLDLTDDGTSLKLDLRYCGEVASLRPLKGIPIAVLNLMGCPVGNLSPLKNMPLVDLNLKDTEVSDLSPLQGLPISRLVLQGCPVADLLPLKNMPLRTVDLRKTMVADLSPLKSMDLTSIEMAGTEVRDLSPLEGMPLTDVALGDPFFAACPANDLSPLKGMALTRLNLRGSRITNLSVLVGMPLQDLDLRNTEISDLSPLLGMPLTHLDLGNCSRVIDLAPLEGMPLAKLRLQGLKGVSDLSPLKGMQLTTLELFGCESVSDLSPLAGMPLAGLDLTRSPLVTDLSPLATMPLTSLLLHPDARATVTGGIEEMRAKKDLFVNGSPADRYFAD